MISEKGTEIIRKLIRLCFATTAIVAAGAVTQEPSDPFPSLDLYLTCDDGFAQGLALWLASLGAVAFSEVTPTGYHLVTSDGVAIAIYIGLPLPLDAQSLFNRTTPESSPLERSLSDEWLRPAQFWRDLHLAAAAIGRGHTLSAHGGLELCRLHVINLYRLALAPSSASAGWHGADRTLGRHTLAGLKEWLVAPLDVRAQWQNGYRLATTYESLVLPLCERIDIRYPWAMRNLAFQRLEQVKPAHKALEEVGMPMVVPAPEPEPGRAPTGGLRLKGKIRRPNP
jgi:hypothetical protein